MGVINKYLDHMSKPQCKEIDQDKKAGVLEEKERKTDL